MLAAGADEVELIEGRGGVFDVRRDGELKFSKKHTGRYPSDAELDALARA